MHTLVLHRDIYDDHPWVAREMYEAMCEAKAVAMNRLFDTNALSVSLPWLVAHVEETREAMGDDYWPYGFEPNRHTVETLTQYSYEQGLSDRKVDPEELFADELLRTGGSGDEYYREQRLDLDAGRE
jgi:4,5-dihydroxyphthalate decarboxylase